MNLRVGILLFAFLLSACSGRSNGTGAAARRANQKIELDPRSTLSFSAKSVEAEVATCGSPGNVTIKISEDDTSGPGNTLTLEFQGAVAKLGQRYVAQSSTAATKLTQDFEGGDLALAITTSVSSKGTVTAANGRGLELTRAEATPLQLPQKDGDIVGVKVAVLDRDGKTAILYVEAAVTKSRETCDGESEKVPGYNPAGDRTYCWTNTSTKRCQMGYTNEMSNFLAACRREGNEILNCGCGKELCSDPL